MVTSLPLSIGQVGVGDGVVGDVVGVGDGAGVGLVVGLVVGPGVGLVVGWLVGLLVGVHVGPAARCSCSLASRVSIAATLRRMGTLSTNTSVLLSLPLLMWMLPWLSRHTPTEEGVEGLLLPPLLALATTAASLFEGGGRGGGRETRGA